MCFRSIDLQRGLIQSIDPILYLSALNLFKTSVSIVPSAEVDKCLRSLCADTLSTLKTTFRSMTADVRLRDSLIYVYIDSRCMDAYTNDCTVEVASKGRRVTR